MPKIPKQKILEFFQHSHLKTVEVLRIQEDKIWRLIQKKATTKTKEKSLKYNWRNLRHIFSFPMVGVVGAGLAVFIFIVYKQQEVSQTIQNSVTSIAAVFIIHKPQETIKNPEQEEVNQELVQETPEEIKPARPEYLPVHKQSIRDLVGGFGGGNDTNYSAWKIEYPLASLADNTPETAPLVETKRLSDERMTEVLSILGAKQVYYRNEGISYRMAASQELPLERFDCLRADDFKSFPADMNCISLNNYGELFMQQNPDQAKADGQQGALNYISEITELPVSDFGLTPYTYNLDGEYANLQEFDIYQKTVNGLPLPYHRPLWHLATYQNKLVFLYTKIIPTAIPADANVLTLITPSEAVDRLKTDMQVDFSQDQEGKTIQYTINLSMPFGEFVNLEDTQVHIVIKDLALEYRLFEHYEDSGSLLKILLPVYRFTGIETNSNITFEVYVDATKDLVIMQKYL